MKLSAILLLLIAVMEFSACSNEHTNAPADTSRNTDSSGAPTAADLMVTMGTGFNLGNTFDLTQHSTTPESIRPIIDLYYNAGMRHIRIPVTWMESVGGSTLANTNGVINFQHTRFLQLKAVIDYALEKNMVVVLNTHHEHWLKNNYNGSASYDTIFTTLWRGIATYFKDYPYQLVFEILNEPEGVFGDWNGGTTPDNMLALTLTRKIYNVGYKAIRETGGKNTKRIIMVSTNGQGNQSQIEEVYPNKESLPGGGSDAYLAIQVHTYDPWSFCGQTGSNAAWPGTNAIVSGITKVGVHARLLGVPVNYGEFGVGRQTNSAERNTDIVRGYYRSIRLAALHEKMSATLWDDRGWFALIGINGSKGYDFMYNIVPTVMAP